MDYTIGQIAHQAGIAPSAIRYYERVGLLLPARRVKGQRRYDSDVLSTLRLIQHARALGFTIAEIRQGLHGFPAFTSPAERWRQLTPPKLVEIERELDRLQWIRQRLTGTLTCQCVSLAECEAQLQP
ncbi:MAG: MerR family transcriptional regulator [Anaerolineae bacterium]|jgi:MerR family redox-sensitive transcriptional activator SoxR|nr:MerR family transcriptional regulator [Anaerolineae bacterium]